ncbi:unnamed protein product, partial [Durusdinium trenchii]
MNVDLHGQDGEEPPAELEEYEQTLLIEKRVTDLTEKCSDFIGAKQGYHIERCIGRGHFGEAFLVRDPSGRRRVLKALELERASLAPPRREAELMQKLRHVHIVRFRDCFEEKGFLGIVMDYARSGDLLALVDRAKETEQPLPEDQVAQWLTQALLGIRYMRGLCIIHRDIKNE